MPGSCSFTSVGPFHVCVTIPLSLSFPVHVQPSPGSCIDPFRSGETITLAHRSSNFIKHHRHIRDTLNPQDVCPSPSTRLLWSSNKKLPTPLPGKHRRERLRCYRAVPATSSQALPRVFVEALFCLVDWTRPDLSGVGCGSQEGR